MGDVVTWHFLLCVRPVLRCRGCLSPYAQVCFFARWPSLLLAVPRPPLSFVVSVLCPRLRRRRPLEALLSGGRVMAVGAGLCAAVMVMLLCVMT